MIPDSILPFITTCRLKGSYSLSPTAHVASNLLVAMPPARDEEQQHLTVNNMEAAIDGQDGGDGYDDDDDDDDSLSGNCMKSYMGNHYQLVGADEDMDGVRKKPWLSNLYSAPNFALLSSYFNVGIATMFLATPVRPISANLQACIWLLHTHNISGGSFASSHDVAPRHSRPFRFHTTSLTN